MSRELQEKADRIIKELEDALVPLKEENSNLKNIKCDKIISDKTR